MTKIQNPKRFEHLNFDIASNFDIRISSFLFYLLVLFLPTQLGRHFWPDFSFVSGIRVDYLAPTLYLTDIFIIALFVFWLIEEVQSSKLKIKSYLLGYWKFVVFVVFVVFLVIGILLSKNQGAGWYGFLKLLEFIFLGFYTARNIKRLNFGIVLFLFSIGIIFESFLGILQYFNQGSIGGIFYFFGERTFNAQTPGIANASVNGELILRPYGTFSHPNVLAGYLLIGMVLILGRIMNHESRIRRGIFIGSLLIGSTTLVLTMSRVSIALWTGFIFLYFTKIILASRRINLSIIHNSKFIIRLLVVLVFIGSIFMFSPLRFRFSEIKLTDESITQRGELIKDSFSMIKSYPVFGVGLNNFLVELPSIHKQTNDVFYLQPVHNIYLLILTQTGIAGFAFFVWFMFKTYKRIRNHELGIRNKGSIIHNSTLRLRSGQEFIILTSVLILGLFDHYFLTLQQGQLLFAFAMGLCWSDPETSSG